MKYIPFTIHCVTNLHAGSNGESHAIIDKTVQRDVTTGYPTIFSSSIKGALREHFETLYPSRSDFINHIFGPPPKRAEGDETQGKYRFFSAQLLCLPVRSNIRPFYRVSSPACLYEFIAFSRNLGFDKFKGHNELKQLIKLLQSNDAIVLDNCNAILEDWLASSKSFEDSNGLLALLFGDENIGLLSNLAFQQVVEKLPVIARNQLEDGISNNLWYEEVVARQTRFYTVIGVPDDDMFWNPSADESKPNFFRGLTTGLVQIGGNATIGYGQCKFSTISVNE